MSLLKLILSLSLIILSMSVSAKEVVNCAHKQIGIYYKWGGHSPKTGFDCSGLAYYCHKYTIPRVSRDQARKNKVSLNSIKPGDLLFFAGKDGKGQIHHTAIYIGNKKYIEAPYTGQKVRITNFRRKIASASRYWK